jgi:predicted nuclease with TOPRIM domain
MDVQDLMELKDQIEEAKAKTSELKGHQTALMKQLKDDWKCNSVEEAEVLVKKMDKQITDLDKQIAKGLQELEENYNQ